MQSDYSSLSFIFHGVERTFQRLERIFHGLERTFHAMEYKMKPIQRGNQAVFVNKDTYRLSRNRISR